MPKFIKLTQLNDTNQHVEGIPDVLTIYLAIDMIESFLDITQIPVAAVPEGAKTRILLKRRDMEEVTVSETVDEILVQL